MQPIHTSKRWFSSALRLLTAALVLALSLGTASQALAGSGFFNDYIIVTGSGAGATHSGATYYYHANATSNDAFQGTDLGTFDRNTGSLVIEGAQLHTFENGGDVIKDSTRMFFRIYKQTAANGDVGQGYSYQPVAIPQTGTGSTPGDRTFETTSGRIIRPNTTIDPINVIRFASGPGVYVVEVYFRAVGTNGGTRFYIYDSNSSANYRATFTISGTDATSGQSLVGQPTTMWLGGVNPGAGCDPLNPVTPPTPSQTTSELVDASEWFDPLLWTNGVPTQVTNTEVPNYSGNQCVVYPNIRTTAQKGPALVKNLTLRGNNTGDRSILRLLNGELQLYGDYVDEANSFIGRANTTFSIVGPRDQSFTGSALFFNVKVDGLTAGGAPTRKTLVGSMVVNQVLTMVNGVLVTGSANSSATRVQLASTTNTDPGGQIVGESETSYVEGYVVATEEPFTGITQAFGNIGLDLTFTGPGTPGPTEVTRSTGFSAAGLLGSKPSIKRLYGVRPTNANNTGNPLVARMGFRYLDRELQGVGPQPSTTNLDETQLTIWVSSAGGGGFQNLGRDRINPGGNRVTQNGINTFATFTLGENQTPLPVHLIYFTAQRTAKGTLVNWGTAIEKDNAGFEVQMSLDGHEFTTLTTVTPASTSSTSAHYYTYTDAVAHTGNVYYRLRQVDTDGTVTYTPVRVVNFGGAGAAVANTTSSVFPNPFHEGEQLLMSLKTRSTGTAVVRITDALGREVARQQMEVAAEATTLSLPSLDSKPAGLYLVQLALPGGAVQTIRIQKQ